MINLVYNKVSQANNISNSKNNEWKKEKNERERERKSTFS